MPVPLLQLCSRLEALSTDADLLARFAAARDEAAFAELVRRHGPVVYRVCGRLVPAHAEDAFQAVFLVLACRVGAVRNPAAVGGWLAGVAGRVAAQLRRAEHRRGVHERYAARSAARDDARPDAGDLAAVLDAELARLPPDLRDPLVLCLVSGRTHEQAAAALGVSARTLRRRLDRARSVLRARLEGRGVVPAVATALVAGAGEATAAVPVLLVQQTRLIVFQFLGDGAPNTAATALAKGVLTGMTRLKTSALVAAAAAVLVCMGVGAAQPEAPPAPRDPAPTAPPPGSEATGPKRPPDPLVAGQPGGEHRSANFLVSAPTAVAARVIASEAEHHRRALALNWLGKELPPWPQRCEIRYTAGLGASSGTTTFTFGRDEKGRSGMKSAAMELHGDLTAALKAHLPHEVTHTVLASCFGVPIPRWADEGISVLAESDADQFAYAVRVREQLNAGRGIRLKVLLRMTEYPRDLSVLYGQGHSVAGFLAGKAGKGLPELKELPDPAGRFPNPGADGNRRLIAFVRLGSEENTAESWDGAAKAVYGYASVDALEEDWMASLETPPKRSSGSRVRRPGTAAAPDLIPPTRLPVGPESTEVPPRNKTRP